MGAIKTITRNISVSPSKLPSVIAYKAKKTKKSAFLRNRLHFVLDKE